MIPLGMQMVLDKKEHSELASLLRENRKTLSVYIKGFKYTLKKGLILITLNMELFINRRSGV